MRRSGRILTVLSLVCLATLSLATAQPQQDVGLHRRTLIERHAILAARQTNNDGGSNNNDEGAVDGADDDGNAGGSDSASSSAAGAASTPITTTERQTSTSTSAPTSRSTSSTAAADSTTTASPSTTTSTTPSSTTTSTSTSSSSSTASSSTASSSTTTSSSTALSTSSTSSSSSSVASTTTAKTTAAQVAQGGVKTITSTLQLSRSSTNAGPAATESVASAAAAKGASSNGFFSNKGAVAGTFTAVGLVVVAAIGFLFFRRRQNQRRYIEDEFFEKYPSANDAAPHAGADYDMATDPDAGHTTEVASSNAYPPRDIHYGGSTVYGDSYSGNSSQPQMQAVPRPPKENAGYDAHAANDYGAAGNYSSWLGPPPQAAAYGGGETDSRPNTQFAGVGAGFASNNMPQQYQSAHADLLADDGQGAYAQRQYQDLHQGYDQQQSAYAGQQQYQDQAYAVTTAHPFADPANATRGYGATNAGGPMAARNTYDRESGDSFYGTGQAA